MKRRAMPAFIGFLIFVVAPVLSAQQNGYLDDARLEQQRTLSSYHLTEPPDLRSFGLERADGLYRRIPADGRSETAEVVAPQDLALVLDRMLANDRRQNARRERLRRLKEIIPNEEAAGRLGSFSDSGLEALSEYLANHPDEAPKLENAAAVDQLRGLLDASAQAAVPMRPPDSAGQLDALKKSDVSRIALSRRQLLQWSSSDDPDLRAKSVALLGRLHDESLTPFFSERLADRSPRVRDSAAMALNDIMESKADYGNWAPYIRIAPTIVRALASSPDQIDFGRSSRWVVKMSLANLNFMQDDDKADFINAFRDSKNDPKVLLSMLASNDMQDINAGLGLHSENAKKIIRRLNALTGGAPLSRVIADPAIKPVTRLLAVARYNSYDQLAGELKRDPELARQLPRLLFSDEAVYGDWLRPADIFSVGEVALQAPGGEFYRSLMGSVAAMPVRNRVAAMLFLQLHKRQLPAAKGADVDRLVWKYVPADVLSRLQSAPQVRFYGDWPDRRLNAAVVIPQPDFANVFIASLKARKYRVVGDSRSSKRVVDLVREDGGREIRLRMEIFPSVGEGWARSSKDVTEALVRYMRDPDYQVVTYRGHAGDYYQEEIGRVQTRHKVFADLSCYSDFRSQMAISRCQDCAYFGTSTTAEGAHNNIFLEDLIQSLSEREDYNSMQERFRGAFPDTLYRFTGTWASSNLWKEVLESTYR